jgi:hypothetical protein
LALFDSRKMPAVKGGRYKNNKVLLAGRRDLLALQSKAIKD